MSFRRPSDQGAGCDVKDCPKLATQRLCFRVWATVESGMKIGAAAECTTGLIVCDDHRDSPDTAIFDDVGWSRIREGFVAAGRMAPDRSTLEVYYQPLPDIFEGI